MTATLTATPVASTTDRRRAMLALARIEAVRQLRSPVTIVAAVLFLAPWIYGWIAGTMNEFPVLHEESVEVQFLAMLVLGNAALITVNFAALRPHRHRVDVLFDVLVLPTAWRTGALLLAVLAPTALALVLLVVRIGALALLPGAAGRVLPLDVLIVPTVVALFGVLGVLLARLTRSAVVAPVVALLLTSCAFIGPVGGSSATKWRLLLPIVTPEFPMPLPLDIFGRPGGRHLVYVVGLVAVLAVLALLRSGVRWPVWAAGGVATAVMLTGAVTQFRVDDSLEAARRTATESPASVQTCRTLDGVEYCAFDGFEPWVEDWNAVLRDVRRATPVAAEPFTVRQRVWATPHPTSVIPTAADIPPSDPSAVPIGTEWGDRYAEAMFAAAVAYRLVAGEPWPGDKPVCGSRGALVVWLVGQVGGRVTEGLRLVKESSTNRLEFFDSDGFAPLAVPNADAAAGLALLEKPGAAGLVRKHWTELTAPGTDAGRFAALVGVEPAPQPPTEERLPC
ncbi:hypothetical protein [Cryptosporangium arvum]|uniref:hypothetical protein n=1 Tax=Cryptosporangium arvum TaxID=80871 RepID=UPI0004B99576|nr:hypothetical protein [Cryptosporangium arvum]